MMLHDTTCSMYVMTSMVAKERSAKEATIEADRSAISILNTCLVSVVVVVIYPHTTRTTARDPIVARCPRLRHVVIVVCGTPRFAGIALSCLTIAITTQIGTYYI